MPVSLSKGGNVSLTKSAAPGLNMIMVGLGWDSRITDGAEFDLDASVFMVGASGRVNDDLGFIFYGNLNSPDGSVRHSGDKRSGEDVGDDERVHIELQRIPANVTKLVFAVTIHEADDRRQNFGQVANAYMRVVNEADNVELARYDLSEDASTETAMVFGEVYRHNDEWKFRAVGSGFSGGLGALARAHGVNIG